MSSTTRGPATAHTVLYATCGAHAYAGAASEEEEDAMPKWWDGKGGDEEGEGEGKQFTEGSPYSTFLALEAG